MVLQAEKTASSQGFDGEEAWCLACSERMEDMLLVGPSEEGRDDGR